MKQLAILLFLFCSVSLFAQGKLAINDYSECIKVYEAKRNNELKKLTTNH
jgi:hypothetical protein